MDEGVVVYPEGKFAGRAGMSIEFKYVFIPSLLMSFALMEPN
jgi:hypothetical protein